MPTWTGKGIRAASKTKRLLLGQSGSDGQKPSRTSAATPEALFPYPEPSGPTYRRITAILTGMQWTYPEIVWARRATRVARRLCRRERYHATIVSSPPHVSHLVGLAAQREFGIPFLADFRDLWKAGTGRYDRLDPISRWMAGRHEARVYREAHTVIFNTTLANQTMLDLNLVGGNAVAIANGFDTNGGPRKPDGEAFRIVLTGQFYPFSDLEAFFLACRSVRDRIDHVPIRVDFVGTPATHRGVPLADLARFHGLGDVFALHERVSREDAARLQQAAALLVAYDQANRPAIPVKFYDYAQTFGTMLLLGEPGSDLSIAASRLGVTLRAADDRMGIDGVFDAALQRWRCGRYDRITDPTGIFDRVHQSRKLHELLTAL
jgi:hypothetical protein